MAKKNDRSEACELEVLSDDEASHTSGGMAASAQGTQNLLDRIQSLPAGTDPAWLALLSQLAVQAAGSPHGSKEARELRHYLRAVGH